MKSVNNLQIDFPIGKAITPLDGRNSHKLKTLRHYFSDFELNRLRLMAEIAYVKQLSQTKIIRRLTQREIQLLDKIIIDFSYRDYLHIREIEKITNHETKAVEVFLQQKLGKTSLKDVSPMVHFGLTSEDITSIAYALMIKNTVNQVLLPELKKIVTSLAVKAKFHRNLSMLGRTHGQPAAPTTLGKEFLVYHHRLEELIGDLKQVEFRAKMTGNTGNLNAHQFIFPKIDWLKFSKNLIKSLGLTPDFVTTQIEPYDSMIKLFFILTHINNLLIGLSIDCWYYISLGYFQQLVVKQEVGSTALPHKVNPIYFEGAEGGFGIANALLKFYCRKLACSRLQRDLSDSTVRRSIGIAFGYCLLSYQSINQALERIEPNKDKIIDDLNSHWEVLSEAVQNYLRVKGYDEAYDQTKKLFRGRTMNQQEYVQSINQLNISKEDGQILIKLSPENYIGFASIMVKSYFR